MTDIPEDIMREATGLFTALDLIKTGLVRVPWPQDEIDAIAHVLLAAEKRGAERERKRAENIADELRRLPGFNLSLDGRPRYSQGMVRRWSGL